jgi:RNA polymerase sigma-70 factor (ECF subfamily)
VRQESTRRDTINALRQLTLEGADEGAQENLFTLVYAELRSLAGILMSAERAGHSLQPTELVHEAYLRLVMADASTWEGRAHFLATAARAMRRILVDHARRRGAAKRGGARTRVSLRPEIAPAPEPAVDLLHLDDCLRRMADLDERMARLVELRVFAGMTHREAAYVLGVSTRTAEGDWSLAKRWLRRELEQGS